MFVCLLKISKIGHDEIDLLEIFHINKLHLPQIKIYFCQELEREVLIFNFKYFKILSYLILPIFS